MLRDLLQVLEAEAIFGSTPPHPQGAAAGAAAGGAHGGLPLPASGALVGGFECVFVQRCAEPASELARFKRLMSLAGRFAHSLHDASGAPVRGVQGLVLQGPAKAQARAEAQAVGGVHGGAWGHRY